MVVKVLKMAANCFWWRERERSMCQDVGLQGETITYFSFGSDVSFLKCKEGKYSDIQGTLKSLVESKRMSFV